MKPTNEDKFDLVDLFERINTVRFDEIQTHITKIWATNDPMDTKIVKAFELVGDTLTNDTREEEAFCIGTQVGISMVMGNTARPFEMFLRRITE